MRALFFLLLFTLSSAAQATDVGYEVELIIFEDTTGRYGNTEQWEISNILNAPQQEQAQADNALSQQQDKKTEKQQPVDAEFQELPTDKFKLTEQAKKLIDHSQYNVLVHRAWKQTGLDKDKAFPVKIDSSRLTEQKPVEEAVAITLPASKVSGEVKLIMSRYLHLNTDLVYQKPHAPQSTTITGENNTELSASDMMAFDSYPLKFERRMRSREIHYIDHPLVGIIFLATPYKIASEEEPATTGGYKTL